jgi:hypothetical protein
MTHLARAQRRIAALPRRSVVVRGNKHLGRPLAARA